MTPLEGLIKAVEDALFAMGCMRIQLASWGHRPTVNAEGIEASAHTALTRAKAALAETGWRDIESAPRDGTRIIVHGGIAHWHDGCWKTLTGEEYPGREIEWPITVWRSAAILIPPPSAPSPTPGAPP